MLHSAHDWRAGHEGEPAEIISDMLAAFFQYSGIPPRKPQTLDIRWWPDAAAVKPLDCDCLWHAGSNVGLCGDWCAMSRVEGAFLSGTAVAGRILNAAWRAKSKP
jgi:predicted NAD/FAD-dependent oxidoreductase